MIIFPAIDLKDGACVRLEQGLMDKATVFNADPADQARSFEALGFEWLHLVDLNGAFDGKPVNADAVRRIRDAVTMPIQLGGGIRTRETAALWLDAGITRVILGTVAAKDPALVRELADTFPDRIVVGIDAREGKVAIEGWATEAQVTALDLAKRFEDAGVAAIIYTDISRDGMLSGPNTATTAELARHVSIPVIASGGVSSLDDLKTLKDRAADGIAGAVIGRALYDGRIDPAAALALSTS